MHESAAANLDKKAGTFIRLNKAVGPFGAVLFFFAMAVISAICVLAMWVRVDVVKPVVEAHRENLLKQDQRAEKNEERAQRNELTQAATKEALESIAEKLDRSVEVLTKTMGVVEQQTEWHRRSTEEQRKTNQLLQTGRIKVSNGPETADGKSPMPMDGTPN